MTGNSINSIDNVTYALKPTVETSYFRLFVLSVMLGPFLLIALLALANAALPAHDAEAFKKPLLGVWAWIASVSGGGAVISGLMKTWGKISTQRACALQTRDEGSEAQ